MNAFQAYLQRQYRKHGAVAPHDRLRVVEQLLERARSQGVFPVSETAVGRVDPNHPGVRTILEAPETPAHERKQVGRLRMPNLRMPDRTEMAEWPTWKKLAFIGGVVFGILFLTLAAVGVRRFLHRRADSRPSPTPMLTSVALAMPLPAASPTPLPPPSPTPTPLPPTPTPPTPSAPAAASPVMPQAGIPADDPAAPVAVEVEGYPQPIPVYKAEIGKEGRWTLPRNGAQWLPESYIRKVFALGPDVAAGLRFRQGGRVRVRTRGGYVESYVLTRQLTVPATQIEVMHAQRPSVLLVFASGQDHREVWLAELPEVLAYAHAPNAGASSSASAPASTASSPAFRLPGLRTRAIVVVEGARLRAAPSLQARVLRSLPSGTLLELDGQTGGIQRDRYIWYRVLAPYPGWIANVVIQILIPNP